MRAVMRCASRGSCGCGRTSRPMRRIRSSEPKKFSSGKVVAGRNIPTVETACNPATQKPRLLPMNSLGKKAGSRVFVLALAVVLTGLLAGIWRLRADSPSKWKLNNESEALLAEAMLRDEIVDALA